MGHKEWRQGISAPEELDLFRLVARGEKAKAELEAAEKCESPAFGTTQRCRLESDKAAGEDACSQLAVAYRLFSEKAARDCKRVMPKRFGLDELKSLAFIALHEFLRRYNPEIGSPFTAFARKNLISEIKRRAYNDDDILNMGRTTKDLRRRIRKAEARLIVDLGRYPSLEEIAAEVEVPVEQVSVLRQPSGTESIDSQEEAGTGEDRWGAVPKPLRTGPTGRQAGAGLYLEKALDSMQEFFDTLLTEGEGSAEQHQLIDKIRRSLRGGETLFELREWLLESSRPQFEDRRRLLEALPWRLLTSAIGRHHVNHSAGGPVQRPHKRTPAHLPGTGALECRARRREVVDGQTLQPVSPFRGSV